MAGPIPRFASRSATWPATDHDGDGEDFIPSLWDFVNVVLLALVACASFCVVDGAVRKQRRRETIFVRFRPYTCAVDGRSPSANPIWILDDDDLVAKSKPKKEDPIIKRLGAVSLHMAVGAVPGVSQQSPALSQTPGRRNQYKYGVACAATNKHTRQRQPKSHVHCQPLGWGTGCAASLEIALTAADLRALSRQN